MKPYWHYGEGGRELSILHGHVLDVLGQMPEHSVHCAAFSPPYFGLRHYAGLPPTVWGGAPDCAHSWVTTTVAGVSGGTRSPMVIIKGLVGFQMTPSTEEAVCRKCGAWRGFLGRESLHDCLAWARGEPPCGACYMCHLRMIFAALRRVMRPDGAVWLNLGDSYANTSSSGLAPKNLYGIPLHAGLAIQADGWWLRATIPWIKRAGMPESVRDRPTNTLEWVLLLAAGPDGFYDVDAVAIDQLPSSIGRAKRAFGPPKKEGWTEAYKGNPPRGIIQPPDVTRGRRRRNTDWWMEALQGEITDQRRSLAYLEGLRDHGGTLIGEEAPGDILGFHMRTAQAKQAHFAAWPEQLVRPMILASTSAVGVCPRCGTQWTRVVVREDEGLADRTFRSPYLGHGIGHSTLARIIRRDTVAWRPGCTCGCDEPHVHPDDLDLIATPLGERLAPDTTQITGRRGLGRPRGPDEGVRLITRYEQRKYAAQIKASPHREDMAREAGEGALAHYMRTDRSGARPVPPDLLEAWIDNGWLERVTPPAWKPPEPVPATVLDPFLGRGTTLLVAWQLGRSGIGIELSEPYCQMAQAWLEERACGHGPPVESPEGDTWQQLSF